MRMLITGASGLLGGNLCKLYSSRFEKVYGTYFSHEVRIPGCELIRLDLGESTDALNGVVPDVIVHCAADADVDACERNPERAQRSILTVTQHVVAFARKCNAFLIHISTDSLFDGKKAHCSEDDPPSPVNLYSRLKAEAESWIKRNHDQSCIVRTRFYGWNIQDKRCFAEHVISQLRDGKKIRCYEDNYSTQILVNNLADVIMEIIEKRARGVFNIVDSARLSRYSFARMVAEVFDLHASLLLPVPFSEGESGTPRAQDTSLSNDKARSVFKTRILPVREGLEEMKRLEISGYKEMLKNGR